MMERSGSSLLSEAVIVNAISMRDVEFGGCEGVTNPELEVGNVAAKKNNSAKLSCNRMLDKVTKTIFTKLPAGALIDNLLIQGSCQRKQFQIGSLVHTNTRSCVSISISS